MTTRTLAAGAPTVFAKKKLLAATASAIVAAAERSIGTSSAAA